VPLEPYPREEALKELFISGEDFDHIIDALERKKNVVLEGPPRIGKTFVAKRLAYRMIRYKIPENVRMVQFHQSYAYEDFISSERRRKLRATGCSCHFAARRPPTPTNATCSSSMR